MGRTSPAWVVCLVLLAGVASLSLLSCGGGGSSSNPRDEVIITPPGNRAPVIERTLEDITLTLEAGRTVQWESAAIRTYFSDPDNDTLQYRATSSNTGVADTVFSQTGATLTVRAAGAGTATVTLTATDPGGLSVTQNFTVTVFPADHSNTDVGASEIIAGQTVEGYINSPDDVDYFRLPLAEPSTVTVTLELELAGVEVSLLDGAGNVLATAETASAAVIREVVVNAAEYLLKVQLTSKTLAPEDLVIESLPASYRLLVEALSIPKAGPERVKIKQGAPFVGSCRCLAFVEPEGETADINLNDYFEGQPGASLRFSVQGELPDGLTVDLNHATGRLVVSAPRGAYVGRHKFRLRVEEEDNPETNKVFTVEVNVVALPILLPGQSLTVRAEPGKRTRIDLTDIIGPPANVGGHGRIRFELDVNDPGTQPSISDLLPGIESNDFLVVKPPSDLEGVFSLKVLAWFPDAEVSRAFTFRFLVWGAPRRIDGSPPLSVELGQGGKATIALTDYIEDPGGGTLTFKHGALPRGFGVTRDGPTWTIGVESDVATGRYNIVVTATNESGLSAEFALQVVVEEGFGKYWLRAQNVDCHVNDSPRPPYLSLYGEDATYSGECIRRKAHGEGTWIIGDPESPESEYDGQWQNGYRHGLGTYRYLGTLVSLGFGYQGQWQEGVPHGRGISWEDDNLSNTVTRYEGQFQDGVVSQGTLLHGYGSKQQHSEQEIDTSRTNCRVEGEWRRGGIRFRSRGNSVVAVPGLDINAARPLGLWNGTITTVATGSTLPHTNQVRNGRIVGYLEATHSRCLVGRER